MADVFEARRELDQSRQRLWALIESTPNLDWLLLTKRPERVPENAPWKKVWPTNVWLGTTVENQHWASKRIPALLNNRAKVLFISAEPLLGPVDLRQWLRAPSDRKSGLDWVIAGGESGPHARPMNPAWVVSLQDQCAAVGAAFHFKQWGHWGPDAGPTPNTKKVELHDGAQRVVLWRVGKHAAGRTLKGRTWDGFPLERASN